ncbi:MAG TPA: hypothetical protein VF395_05425 [Polyangiaceae bacterium]
MADTIILTGCASGIGKRMAHALYERGHRLVITDVKPLELVRPSPGTQQGNFAKLANAFPELGLRVSRQVSKAGRLHQKKLRST